MFQRELKVARLQPPPASPSLRRPMLLTRCLTVAAIMGVAVFLVVSAQKLWREWTHLQMELGRAAQSAVVGYRDIAPVASYAQGPNEWFRDSGDESQLWWRWEGGVGHKWFHFTRGDIEQARLRRPITKFISRAIDYPVVEINGGEIWQRIPSDSTVVSHTLRGLKCVYPTAVLGKVQVVNDLVQDHPFLVVVNLFAPPTEAFSIFDSDHEGHRLTMAPSGYFHDGKPLLYDRGTESLWSEVGDGLRAIAGKHKGIELARVAHPVPITWQAWRSQNQQFRLLVGADRSHGIPLE
jgi:hypothetical protein